MVKFRMIRYLIARTLPEKDFNDKQLRVRRPVQDSWE
jgi:hypothetical protein